MRDRRGCAGQAAPSWPSSDKRGRPENNAYCLRSDSEDALLYRVIDKWSQINRTSSNLPPLSRANLVIGDAGLKTGFEFTSSTTTPPSDVSFISVLVTQ